MGTKSGNTYTYRINVSDHNREEGNYITHIYAYDKAGNFDLHPVVATIDRTDPVISDVKVTDVSYKGYTVSCTVTDNYQIARVQFPTWTDRNGQDDIQPSWETSVRASGTKSGNTYTYRVNREDHNHESGNYRTHILAYDACGNKVSHIVDSVAVPAYVNVTGITLEPDSQTLNLGESVSLTPTVSPANATNKNVMWTSSDKSVAEVDATGKVTAVGGGEAIITATTEENAKTAACKIKVTVEVSRIELDQMSLELIGKGTAEKLTATVTPSNATDKSVLWSSSDTAVATVSPTGVVTAQGSGSAIITAKTIDEEKTASCTVSVVIPVTGVELDKTRLDLTENHLTDILTATVIPSDATNKKIVWSSSDPSIVTIIDGEVVGVETGSATITVTTEDGKKTASCNVSVIREESLPVSCTLVYDANGGEQAPADEKLEKGATAKISSEIPIREGYQFLGWAETPNAQKATFMPGDTIEIGADRAYMVLYALWQEVVEGISLNKAEANLTYIGQSDTLTAYAQPTNRVMDNVIWSSSQADVASVSNAGILTAIGNGTAVISAETKDGAHRAECIVTVKVAVETISLNYGNVELYKKGDTIQLEASVFPHNAMNQNITWTSSDTAVAVVDASGLVTAVGNGMADITVTAEDNGTSRVCKVKVSYEEACAHVWGEYSVDQEPTCEEPGQESVHCAICGVRKENSERSIPATNHTYGQSSTVMTSCEQPIVLEKTCTACGYVDRRESPAPGHQFEDVVILENATCQRAGKIQTTCIVCHEKKEEEIPRTDHNFEIWEIIEDATCTVDGQMRRTCAICGTTETETMTASGHIAGEWEIVQEATYGAEGERVQKCEMCMEEMARESIPRLDRCEHVWGNDTVARNATCTESGEVQRTCAVCGEIEVKTIEATGHLAGEWMVVREATQDMEGERIQKCLVCEAIIATEKLEKLEKQETEVPPTEAPLAEAPSTEVTPPTSHSLAAGTSFRDKKSGGIYRVSKVGASGRATVEYKAPYNKNASSVQIPNVVVMGNVAYKVESVAANAFKNSKKLKKVKIGNQVEKIGKNAFYGCAKLKEVTIGANVKSIGAKAFFNCVALKKITVPSKVSTIGAQAFYGCKNLKTITIKTAKLTTKKVGSKAFAKIHKKAVVTVPKKQRKEYQKIFQKSQLRF